MCTSERHKYKTLPDEFCQLWENMESILQQRDNELKELKIKNLEVIKLHKQYKADYASISTKWQNIYEPLWDKFDEKFNSKAVQ